MANKTLKTRIINKHDTQTNWAKAVNFIPKAGEVIVYTDLHKVKVGDGTTKVSALPFIDEDDTVVIDLGTLSETGGTLSSEILAQINNNLTNKSIIFEGTISGISITTATYFVSANMIIISALASSTIHNLTIKLTDGRYETNQVILLDSVDTKTINNTSLLGAGNIEVQEPLVSGTNIKTINNQSILGNGNIEIGESVFDITPYLTSETSISIEGYNAVREFVSSNKGGIIKITTDGVNYLYVTCTSINNDTINLSQCEFSGYEGSISTISLGNDGIFSIAGSDFVRVTPNPSNPTPNPTSILKTIGIGGSVYTIPTVNNATITIQQEGVEKGSFTLNQSSNATINLDDTTYSTATSSILGLVKSSTTGTTSGRDYKVQVNSDGTMKVNVPWTDTKYTLPSDVVHDSDLDNYATTSYVNQQIGNVKKAALQVVASKPSTGAEGTIYLVGSSAPYEMWTYENDVWIDLGSTEIDLSNYVPTSRKINGHALTADITITKSDVSLGNVVNTGDSATPTNGGTTKFTTGGAYTMQTTLQNAINGKANTNHTHTISQITDLGSYLTYEDLGTI